MMQQYKKKFLPQARNLTRALCRLTLMLCMMAGTGLAALAQTSSPNQTENVAPSTDIREAAPGSAIQSDLRILRRIQEKTEAAPDDLPTVGLFNLDQLRVFGASLFERPVEPLDGGIVDPSHIVSIGDQIQIALWGAVNEQFSLSVDGQGNLFVPRVGVIAAQGRSFGQLSAEIEQAVQQIYSGANVYVNLGQAQPIRVFVTGYVRYPGRYLGRSNDSILYYLSQAGGIDRERGSFRRITLIRQKGEPVDFDLYDFLLDGEMARPALNDGDTIVVGERGSALRVAGAVQNVGIFEFSDDRISGAEIAQVALPTTATTHVFVRGHQQTEPIERYMELDEFKAVSLQENTDVVFLQDKPKNVIGVSVEGPGVEQSIYTVAKGTSLRHLLQFIRTDPDLADLSAIHLRRKSVAVTQKELLDESIRRLQEAMFKESTLSTGEIDIRSQQLEILESVIGALRRAEPQGILVVADNGVVRDVRLEDGDVIVIPEKTDIVYIGGEVTAPQTFRYEAGMRPADYIAKVGGLTDLGRRNKFIVQRLDGSIVFEKQTDLRPGDRVVFVPHIRTNIFQAALDVSTILARAVVFAAVLDRN